MALKFLHFFEAFLYYSCLNVQQEEGRENVGMLHARSIQTIEQKYNWWPVTFF